MLAQGPKEVCLSLEHQNPSKTSEKWVILIALHFRYTFYTPQTKRLRARKISLQYKMRKGRKQIWGRFSNPWNSNGIEWNRLILLTWSRIFMYLPNTVGKRHKKRSNSFSASETYGFEIALSFAVHRNRLWRKWRCKVNARKIGAIKGDGKPTRLLPFAKMLLVAIKFFPLLGRLCSGRFYIFTEQMWF